MKNENQPAMQRAGERAFQTEGVARTKGIGTGLAGRGWMGRLVEGDIRELDRGQYHERPCRLWSGVKMLV